MINASSSSSEHTSSFALPFPESAIEIPTSSIAPSPATTSSAVPSLPPVHPMTTRSKVAIFKPKHPLSLFASVTPAIEPKNFTEAVKHKVWQKAMAEEYEALVKQGTLTLVPPPSYGNIIGCQ